MCPQPPPHTHTLFAPPRVSLLSPTLHKAPRPRSGTPNRRIPIAAHGGSMISTPHFTLAAPPQRTPPAAASWAGCTAPCRPQREAMRSATLSPWPSTSTPTRAWTSARCATGSLRGRWAWTQAKMFPSPAISAQRCGRGRFLTCIWMRFRWEAG